MYIVKEAGKQPISWSTISRRYSIYLVLLALVVISSIINSNFLSGENISNVARQISVTTINPAHAKNVSLQVSLLTNYLVKPNFVTAFAAAAYSLEPEGMNAANNFASAILGAGERFNPDPSAQNYAKLMGPYRGDAEAFFIFSVAASMKADAFVEASMTPLINLGNLYIDHSFSCPLSGG